MSQTITEFLEARIAEDEQLAESASVSAHKERHENQRHYGSYVLSSERDSTEAQDEFILQWWPARVLAECAAKRAILALHHPDRQLENWYWSMRKCAECGGKWHKWLNNDVPTDIGPEQGCPTLRALAAVYADHLDYQQDWS